VPYLVVAGAGLEPEYEKWLSKTVPQAAVTVRHNATNNQHDQLRGPGSAATYQTVQSAGSTCDPSRLAPPACTQGLSARRPLPACGLVSAAAHRTGCSVPR
jgi:hypothetical protein